MIATRQQIIDEARAWLDTPFQHQGRTRHVAVDCAGLVVGVARGLCLSTFDKHDYARSPDGVTMRQVLDEQMGGRVEFENLKPGDALYMAYEKQPQHMAIVTRLDPIYIIHANSQASGGGRVVEHRLDSVWLSRIRGCYRFPGVID